MFTAYIILAVICFGMFLQTGLSINSKNRRWPLHVLVLTTALMAIVWPVSWIYAFCLFLQRRKPTRQ